MSSTTYSLETIHQIWNDKTGERLEIGPDRDGLDLIEIREYTDDGQIGNRITMTRGQLVKVCRVLLGCLRPSARSSTQADESTHGSRGRDR